MHRNTILYVAPALPTGGAEKFLVSLSNSSCNENKRQILVSLSSNNPVQPEFDKKIGFHCFAREYKFDFKPVIKLRKLIKLEQPDIIVCLNFFSYFILRCATLGFGKSPQRIISYHSTIQSSRKDDFLHTLYARLLTKNDLIITVSKNQAYYTARRYHIPVNLFKTVYNGIDTNHWKPAPDECSKNKTRLKYALPENAKVIILTAAFRREKNHAGAIKALHILHNTYNCKAYLLLVGNGALMDEVKELAIELKIYEYVKFAGIQQDVRPFYWASDLFTLCSDRVETFSIAALEAMACGLPCVLTDIGGANEMIVDGVNGYLCKPDVKNIAEIWLKAMNAQFSKNIISSYVENHFYIDKMLWEYDKIFNDFLS